MHANRRKLHIIVTFLHFGATDLAYSTAGKNAQDLRAFCNVYHLLRAANNLGLKEKPIIDDTDLHVVRKLNISTSSDTYYDNQDEGTLKDDKQIDSDKQQQWEKEKQAILAEATDGRKKYPRMAPSDARLRANIAIKSHYETAARLFQEARGHISGREANEKDVKAKIQAAFFGGAIDAPKPTDNKGNWATRCSSSKPADGLSIASSAATAMLCLCFPTGDTTDNCNLGSGAQWQDGSNNNGELINDFWTKLKTFCETEKAPTKLTPALIYGAIKSIRDRAGQTNSRLTSAHKFVIGETNDGACDGKATKLCLDYSRFQASSGAGLAWETTLLEAAELIENATAATQAAASAIKQYKEVTRAATIVFETALRTPTSANKSQTTEHRPSSVKPDAESTCNEVKSNKDKCKDLKEQGCTFNEKDKKCELKKDVKEKLEKENQETGGKDGKTTTNTTGSNSFVIKRAPLLLAVLFLA
uniref:Variant surface glycoprotein 1125.398 n=1 Tax=Trypanosoma brucei TaxID=5691 RepID=A0A1J0R4B5_9TRYP|nr:variant surface glycoprotein 1125.398 [Trypanosoma brucei]